MPMLDIKNLTLEMVDGDTTIKALDMYLPSVAPCPRSGE